MPASATAAERACCEALLPAVASEPVAPVAEESFCDTLLDARTYRALVRNLTEEVALRPGDDRVERDGSALQSTARSSKS